MKTFLFSALMVFMFTACSKKESSDMSLNEMINPNAAVVVKGAFSGAGGHNVSGTAEVVNNNNQKQLVLKNFNTTNGPDLRVYLATTTAASAFISLGNLKSTNGQQVYDISGMPDFAQYKYALIWCQQFNVLFGSAELK
ncbi:MAG: DM13 domain-containing protein [Lacibacter sp.]|jgi:hypothetical protein